MSNHSQYEREEQSIIQAECDGLISHEEAQKQIKALWRDYRDAAHEAAQQAYQETLDNW